MLKLFFGKYNIINIILSANNIFFTTKSNKISDSNAAFVLFWRIPYVIYYNF